MIYIIHPILPSILLASLPPFLLLSLPPSLLHSLMAILQYNTFTPGSPYHLPVNNIPEVEWWSGHRCYGDKRLHPQCFQCEKQCVVLQGQNFPWGMFQPDSVLQAYNTNQYKDSYHPCTLPSLSLSLKPPSMIPAFGNGSAKTSWTGFSLSPSLHNVRLVSEHCQYCMANILIPLLPSNMKPASSSLAFIFNRWNPRFLSYL